jgi:hypothetical protein
LPELEGKLDGTALRVPTPNVSAVDLTFEAGKDVTVDDVNEVVREAAAGHMGAVLAYDPEPKVSIDFNHTALLDLRARPDQGRRRPHRAGAGVVRQRMGLLGAHGRCLRRDGPAAAGGGAAPSK